MDTLIDSINSYKKKLPHIIQKKKERNIADILDKYYVKIKIKKLSKVSKTYFRIQFLTNLYTKHIHTQYMFAVWEIPSIKPKIMAQLHLKHSLSASEHVLRECLLGLQQINN